MRHGSWIAVWLSTLLLVLLNGCNAVRVSPTYVNPNAWTFAQGVMAKGPLVVRIEGQPYPGSATELSERVLAEMRAAITWYANPRFTVDPAAAASQSLFILVTFNRGSGGVLQCAGRIDPAQPVAGPAPDGAVAINASFCDETTLIANAGGFLGRSAGIDDPAFGMLIRQTVLELLPRPTLPRYGGAQIQF